MIRAGGAAAGLLAMLALAGCAPLVPLEPPATYANPVLDRDFPDPALLRAPDGRFYAYATQGNGSTVQVARSGDLVAWTLLGDAMPQRPAWARGKDKFWAPHVVRSQDAGRYLMYYSAEPDDSSGKCLAVAIAGAPEGPFVDAGRPILCGAGIEHIDPMAFDDPVTGRRFLYWGSGGEPLRVRELAADGLGFAEGSIEYLALAPDPAKPYRRLIEAAWTIFRDGAYYLFYSGDRCCVEPRRYAVLAARAPHPLGPFEDLGPVLEASPRWIAPGHPAIVRDDAGTDWLFFHAAHAGALERGRVLLLERLEFRAGRPLVEPATADERRAPTVKSYAVSGAKAR